MTTRTTMMMATAVAAMLGGCLFDGAGTEGLPCNVDDDCGAQACVEHVCGGPAAAAGSEGTDGDTDTDEGSGSDGPMPTPQQLPTPCDEGATACFGPDAMRQCVGGKLESLWCEAWCGEGNPVLGGCQADPRDGHEVCWCANQGGPPTGTCGNPCASDSDCSSGEACLGLTTGDECVAAQCNGCFAQGLSCSWYVDSCGFGSCQ